MRQVGSEFVVTVSKLFASMGPEGNRMYISFQMILFYILVAMTIASFLEIRNLKKNRLTNVLESDITFGVLLVLFVLVSRFPTVIYGYQNPDESMWVGCARVFIQEPRLWVSCDSSTSGPLVMFPLIALHFLGIPIDYGSTKLAAGILMSITILINFLTYCKLFGGAVARIIILPLTVAIGLAMTLYWDFLSFNGEQVPMVLLSAGLFVLVSMYQADEIKRWQIISLSFILGLTPFAKLQSVPLALVITLGGFACLIWKKASVKQLLIYGISGIAPCIIFVTWTALSGGLSHFWNSYILFNIFYAGQEVPENVNFFDKIGFGWRLLFNSQVVSFYFHTSVIFCFFCILFTNFKNLVKNRTSLTYVLFSALFFFISLFCVGQAFRPFLHYTFFALLAISLLTGCLVSGFLKSTLFDHATSYLRVVTLSIFLCVDVFYFHECFSFEPTYTRNSLVSQYGYAMFPDVVRTINKYSSRGDRIVVWGWIGSFYSDTDLYMGTRFENTSGIILENSFQDYFMDVYLSDLERNKPRIFVDAITTKAFRLQDRSQYGIDKFPKLNDYVAAHYAMAEEIEGFRIYVRNGG